MSDISFEAACPVIRETRTMKNILDFDLTQGIFSGNEPEDDPETVEASDETEDSEEPEQVKADSDEAEESEHDSRDFTDYMNIDPFIRNW